MAQKAFCCQNQAWGKGSGITNSWAWKELQIFTAAFLKWTFFCPVTQTRSTGLIEDGGLGCGKQKISAPALLATILGVLLANCW